MEAANIDMACPYGGLFQQIISEMKNSAPLWEDLSTRSTKLHSCLRATIMAVSAFLETLQKIADAATNTKGATKDIGTALTRITLRHKALEGKMKTFTSAIMDCLILPLQDRLEEWKKTTAHLDKEHAKEYKRSRGELKKRSIETLRLQKKLRKGLNNGGLASSFSGGTLPRSGHYGSIGGGSSSSSMNSSMTGSSGFGNSDSLPHHGTRDLNRILENALRDTTEKRQAFEETEKQAIRSALIEERSRFCHFVSYLKPVVEEEVGMLYELQHVQEAMLQLEKHASEPYTLPQSSEQVITDLKGSCDGSWFQTPPSSPSSLGSRKSSMCSISSANSSSSGSAHSPSHNIHNRPPKVNQNKIPVGTIRYSSVSSQDSGFTSQDTLPFSRMSTPYYNHQSGNQSGSNTSSATSSNSSTPSSPYPPGSIPPTTTNATWPNLQDSIQFERAACAIMNERPHTISAAYERGQQRPPLTVYTFQPPGENDIVTPVVDPNQGGSSVYQTAAEIYGILRGKRDSSAEKPPVPKRCSSLERPNNNTGNNGANHYVGFGSSSTTPKVKKGSSSNLSGKQKDQPVMNNKPVPNLPDYNQSSDDMIVPQPVYVNMHELNAMAAEKIKRQNEAQDLPPPPPEILQTSNNTAAKEQNVENGDNSGIKEGSLASSGYGSQSQIIVCDDGGNQNEAAGSTLEDILALFPSQEQLSEKDDNSEPFECFCLELQLSSALYCTLPRNIKHFGDCPYSRCRQPKSLEGNSRQNSHYGPGGQCIGHNSRRSSCGNQEKPPPPIRRNSSISSSPNRNNSSVPIYAVTATSGNQQQQQQQQVQQGPIYIQNVAATLNFNHSNNGSQVDSSETTPHASMEHLPPPPAYLMNQQQMCAVAAAAGVSVEDLKRVSVAETIKNLTEKNHQPLSPNMVRRSHSLRDETPVYQNNSNTVPTPNHRESRPERNSNTVHYARRSSSSSVESGRNRNNSSLMQVLNQKLTHQNNQSNSSHGGTNNSISTAAYHPNQHTYSQSPPQQQQHQDYSSSHVTNNSQMIPQHMMHPQQPNSYHQTQQQHQNNQQQPIYQQVVPTTSNSCPLTATANSSTSSPSKYPRRFSEELLRSTATFVQNRVLGGTNSRTPPPGIAISSKEAFMQTLNAKLSQMRQASPERTKQQQQHYPQHHNNSKNFTSKLTHQKGNNVSAEPPNRVEYVNGSLQKL